MSWSGGWEANELIQTKFENKSLATKSSTKGIGHAMWSLSTAKAVTGSDLFTTLWSTIASTLDNLCDAYNKDNNNNNDTQYTCRWKCIRLYSHFFRYLLEGEESPLLPSLRKPQLEPERWTHILTWPFFQDENELRSMANEARGMGKVLASVATEKVAADFDEKVQESMQNGDG